MILVDRALQARAAAGTPLRVGMIGAGFMGRGIANQIVNSVPGMVLAAISNRNVELARRAYAEAGIDDVQQVSQASHLEDCIHLQRPAVTDDGLLLCRAEGLDVLLEVTGDIEFGACVVLEAIANRKPIVLMNAELDGTIGPILKVYADRAGVIVSGCDGDQPGVEMNLYRHVKAMGLTPLVCGNNKGLQDPYRTPATQEAFAKRWGQKPHMVTSFADGTKISFEQATVGNATGMGVARRGMNGFECAGRHFDELVDLYNVDELRRLGGIVDYTVGAKPSPGVFVFAAHDDPKQRHNLNLYKLGEGPLYSFYTPYHLCHFEAPFSLVRAVDFKDTVMAPIGAPVVEVVATAKGPLSAGEILDGIGFYMTYGQCENASVARSQRLLPIGLAEGCRLRENVAKDQVLTLDQVEFREGRLCHRLWAEQCERFFPHLVRSTVAEVG